MKSHAYLREKVLYGLRVRPAVVKPAVAADGSASPVRTKQPARGPTTPSGTSLPPLVYQKFADFVPEYALRSGTTLADVHRPVIDIGDAQASIGVFVFVCVCVGV